MATTVTYKGQTLVTVENATKTLQTKGTWVEDDFTLTDVTQGGGDTLGEAAIGTLTSYTNTDITTLRSYAFAYIPSLETLNLPNLVSAGEYVFRDSGIKYAVFPKYTKNNGWRVFSYNTNMLAVDIIESTSGFSNECFRNSSKLATLIVRGDTLTSLANINAFNTTPFASSGTGGTLYVPSALVSSYQSASNWSTILGYANNSIQAIEGSYYETHYADGTVIE